MQSRSAALALAIGNFVVGLSIVLPTAMLKQLSADFGIGIGAAGMLVTWGAVVLCLGAPVISGLTSRFDRRKLLATTLGIAAVCNLAAVFAPDFYTLLALRLVTMAAVAPFTPQAAGTIALMVSERERPAAIAFVFLGWALVVAFGLPILVFVADGYGWQANHALLAAASAIGAVLLLRILPAGLRAVPVSVASWVAIARHRQILLILCVTALSVGGQFATTTYLGPLLDHLAGAGAEIVGLFFGIFGIASIAGNVAVTRIVGRLGPFATQFGLLLCTIIGVVIWCLGSGALAVMAVGVVVWGLGSSAFLSMQQARIVGAAPALAAASVSLNTSSLYVGQALGSGLGGLLFEAGFYVSLGYLALAFLLAALGVLMLTKGPEEGAGTA